MFYTFGVWDGRKHARIEKNLLTCGNYNYIFNGPHFAPVNETRGGG
jgi:hypothetical protein